MALCAHNLFKVMAHDPDINARQATGWLYVVIISTQCTHIQAMDKRGKSNNLNHEVNAKVDNE